ENEGVIPAPYLARAHWVCLERWDALPDRELKNHLTHAHEIVFAKLPKKTRNILSLPAGERRKLITAKKKPAAHGKGR
ncbi:MAG TPA: MmcQ/YjbR family DNA-binding protein, partial [Pseudacidobacterium sp.]|nr:MmcQ/YjbR family DNA-binding protein [Pseudacidobacterium sp.]